MEFRIYTFEDIGLKGDMFRKNCGYETATWYPFTLEPNEDQFSYRSIPTELIVCDDVFGPVAIFTMYFHDGTRLFSGLAADTITRAAENYIKDHPGKWEVSKIHVAHRFVRRDMSYGKNVECMEETFLICLRSVTQTSS